MKCNAMEKKDEPRTVI